MDLVVYFLWLLFLLPQICIISFLVQPLVLLLISVFNRIFRAGKPALDKSKTEKNYRFGIIITAHKDVSLLPPIVDSILKQTYQHFNAYIVADDCDVNQIPDFKDRRINVLKPAVALHSNTKSIDYALQHFNDEEVMVIFDPDNLVQARFLEVLNIYYNKGFEAVQGNLQPKNTQNIYEKIDTVGMVFYNFIDRDVRSQLNLSVSIWGCGISVKTKIYKAFKYTDKSINGGFDKSLQAQLAKKVKIGYAKEAILYDEKISDGKSLEKQRIRWINSYFKFLSEGFSVFLTGIKKMDFNLTYFGYNLIRPPYFLLILIAGFFIVLDFFVATHLVPFWLLALALFFITILAIVLIKRDKAALSGLLFIKLFFYHQLRSLFRLKLNKYSILKTKNHNVIYIEELQPYEKL